MAEARHDDITGEYYMDCGQYEIMKETETLIADIDLALSVSPHNPTQPMQKPRQPMKDEPDNETTNNTQ
jgi:hypothetical protein